MAEDISPPWSIGEHGHLELVGDQAAVQFLPDGIVGRGALKADAGVVPWESIRHGFTLGVPAVGRVGTRLIHGLGGAGLYDELFVSAAGAGFDAYAWSLGRPSISPYAIRVRNATEAMANFLGLAPPIHGGRPAVCLLGDQAVGPALVAACLASSSWFRLMAHRRVKHVVDEFVDGKR